MPEWLTFTFQFSLSCIGEGNGNPLQCSCLENPRDGGAWWAAVYGVAQSQTRLKWLSSSIIINVVYHINRKKNKKLHKHFDRLSISIWQNLIHSWLKKKKRPSANNEYKATSSIWRSLSMLKKPIASIIFNGERPNIFFLILSLWQECTFLPHINHCTWGFI